MKAKVFNGVGVAPVNHCLKMIGGEFHDSARKMLDKFCTGKDLACDSLGELGFAYYFKDCKCPAGSKNQKINNP